MTIDGEWRRANRRLWFRRRNVRENWVWAAKQRRRTAHAVRFDLFVADLPVLLLFVLAFVEACIGFYFFLHGIGFRF
jgi:hypothetical protein